MKNRSSIHIKTEYVLLSVFILFFTGLFFLSGVQEFPDTNTYIHMHTDREPLYPLFLLFFRTLAGDFSLTAAVIAQNILAAVSCYLLTVTLVRRFGLKWAGTACAVALVLVPHILTPISSASRMVLTDSILSEGITFSLYYLFVFFLINSVLDTDFSWKYLAPGLFTAWLNSLARGQMMCMLLAWAAAAVYQCVRHRKWKHILIAVMAVALAFGLRSLTVKSYNYIFNGYFMGNSGGGTTFLTNILYSAGEEDAADLTGPAELRLFHDIYDRAQDEKLNYRYAPEGVLEQALYHEDTHDKLKFEHVEKYLTWYVSDRMEESGAAREVEIDRSAMEMGKKIIVHSFPKWLSVYFCVALSGFIRTVAVIHPWLNLYALVLYAAALLLLGRRLYRRGMTAGVRFMLLAMLLVCANVFATSLTIMCLSRYMIYNMPVFYAALFLLLRETAADRDI